MPNPDEQFISEPVVPDAGSFDAAAMARGEPGLPAGFTWRGRHYAIVEVLSIWKASEPWNHRPGDQRYYRKRCFRVRLDTGELASLYAVRNVKRGENARQRWWLYTIEPATLTTGRPGSNDAAFTAVTTPEPNRAPPGPPQ